TAPTRVRGAGAVAGRRDAGPAQGSFSGGALTILPGLRSSIRGRVGQDQAERPFRGRKASAPVTERAVAVRRRLLSPERADTATAAARLRAGRAAGASGPATVALTPSTTTAASAVPARASARPAMAASEAERIVRAEDKLAGPRIEA